MEDNEDFKINGTVLERYVGQDENVVVPSGITEIGKEAFRGRRKLLSVIIPEGVTVIGERAFLNCSNLTSVKIPNSVTAIEEQAFWRCENLTDIAIPNSSTRLDNGVFCECRSLTGITLPELQSIGSGLFSGCHKLKSITIPDGVTSIGLLAFYRCFDLCDVTIPNSVTSVDWGAFDYCKNLKFNCYDNGLYLGNDDNPFLLFVKANSEQIESCTIHPDTKIINTYAFKKCTRLTDIKIPNNVISIVRGAFWDCENLKSVTIPSSVVHVGSRAFFGCKNVTFYCEAPAQPESWDEGWNEVEKTDDAAPQKDSCTIVWGYKPNP